MPTKNDRFAPTEPLDDDLADRDPATGRYLRTISGSIDPQVYGIEVANYFLAEAQ